MAFDAPCIHRVRGVAATYTFAGGVDCVTLTFLAEDGAHEMEVYFDPAHSREAINLTVAINDSRIRTEAA